MCYAEQAHEGKPFSRHICVEECYLDELGDDRSGSRNNNFTISEPSSYVAHTVMSPSSKLCFEFKPKETSTHIRCVSI